MRVIFVSMVDHPRAKGFLYAGIEDEVTGWAFETRAEAIEHQKSVIEEVSLNQEDKRTPKGVIAAVAENLEGRYHHG